MVQGHRGPVGQKGPVCENVPSTECDPEGVGRGIRPEGTGQSECLDRLESFGDVSRNGLLSSRVGHAMEGQIEPVVTCALGHQLGPDP